MPHPENRTRVSMLTQLGGWTVSAWRVVEAAVVAGTHIQSLHGNPGTLNEVHRCLWLPARSWPHFVLRSSSFDLKCSNLLTFQPTAACTSRRHYVISKGRVLRPVTSYICCWAFQEWPLKLFVRSTTTSHLSHAAPRLLLSILVTISIIQYTRNCETEKIICARWNNKCG